MGVACAGSRVCCLLPRGAADGRARRPTTCPVQAPATKEPLSAGTRIEESSQRSQDAISDWLVPNG